MAVAGTMPVRPSIAGRSVGPVDLSGSSRRQAAESMQIYGTGSVGSASS